jgi:hypothetical protein
MLTKREPNRDQIPTRIVPSEIRDQRSEKEGGLYSPNPSVVLRQVWSILDGGLASLGLNDHGRPWPPPRRSAIATLCSQYDADLCLKAAQEAREIVQSQDRAPNVTGLFTKKLEELDKVRSVIRESMGAA